MGRNHYIPIPLTQVNILHRTVKDFLVRNAAAKSFLAAAGLTEEDLRLSITRGTFAYAHYLLKEEGGSFFKYATAYILLGLAMEQISIVERLLGAAQSKLMQSLYAYFSLPQGLDTSDWKDPQLNWVRRPYTILSPSEISFDLVGMAASHNMVRYICEVLNLSFVDSEHCASVSL